MTLTAFVVEDSPAIRDSLVETLAELAGIATAGVAGSEQAALAWLTNPVHHWDVAIVDLILEAGGSGLRVLEALRQRPPQRKVVVLTATASPPVRQQCEALGSDRVFDKSIETDALIEYCVSLALQHGSGRQP
ncbi:response regulator [Ramlibacter tataouinensis]|uniref:response regulator n=1 Tax=Ramlibacter tataouinensis TaxID=94132 RepID=UPI0002E02C97|nr:response regulator [Ramlibacter tataouinensis]